MQQQKKIYSASLSRSQGRSSWSVIFRHPVRTDPNTGKPGLRVRQGLGTSSEEEATFLKDQVNEMLQNEVYWSLASKPEAEKRFKQRAVEVFYHGLEPENSDSATLRERFISLPNSSEGPYRRALLLGTTGAGKTTLLRQLIGTDPETERFPSTSTAKTTVHDTEVVLADGPFRAVVTFFPIEEVREHLNECISEAILASYRKASTNEVTRKLLMHVNQRFRFNYVLGNGPIPPDLDDDEDEDDEGTSDPADSELEGFQTNMTIERCIQQIEEIAHQYGDTLKEELGALDEKDQRVVDELFEEELDRRLREDEKFHAICDSLMDELELRFSLLKEGQIRRNKQGWPECWTWEIEDRMKFIKAITRFTSNQASRFGTLLTPLVNGVRVCGPFGPKWSSEERPKLVLLDGEGLGHTPKSVTSISTSLSRRMKGVDAIVIVDNATVPMQAAPVAAIREIIATGNSDKLLIAFTHFDEVKGDNLPGVSAKQQHILASAENVMASVGEELGPFAERALRRRLEVGCFFLGGIDTDLDSSRKANRRSIDQMKELLKAIDEIIEKPAPVEARPVYDKMNLALAVKNAAEAFHEAWWPRLGLSYKSGIGKEHWKRIWALSRRLATPNLGDEYDSLKPVADLRKQLQDRLYVLLQNPLRWDPSEPVEESEKQAVFDSIANALSSKVIDLATKRVRADRMLEWQSAFNQSGRGSSYVRASIIGEQIYERAAPIPDVTPSPDRNSFLHEVAHAVEAVCEALGAKLI